MAKDKKQKSKKNTKCCVICSTEATLTCNNCNGVHYCSKEHQKQNWNEHKTKCKPYVIETNKCLGRHLVAARDLKQGELIFKDAPIVIGPPIEATPLCLNCYKPISLFKKPYCCPKCLEAPICTQTCNGSGHSVIECDKFKTNPNITSEKLIQHCQILMPLRCLFLKESDPIIWGELLKMEAYLEQRRNTTIWRDYKMNIEDIIESFGWLTKEEVRKDLIQRICGILDVNTFEVRVPGFELGPNESHAELVRGVYLQAALMAHDCIGNTHLAVDDYFNMTVHASAPIMKGIPIYFNYTNALQSTYDRQEHLKQSKFYKCTCKRCTDSTEYGTYLSALICVKCHTGKVVPVKLTGNIHKHDSFWKCSDKKCNYVYRGSLIHSTVNVAKNLIEDTDKTEIRSIEALIKKLLQTFVPEHSLIVDLKQCLIGLHSELLRKEPNPNRKILNRKLQLCRELLPVLEKVEPGISRLRGLTLYEMHIPVVILANREYDNNEISTEILLGNLKEAEEMLKKSISFLLYEPSASPEGRLASRAISELKLLRNSITSVEQIIANKSENVDKRRIRKKKNYK